LYTYSRQPRERLRPRQANSPRCKFKRRERVCAESSRSPTVSYSLRSCEFLGDFAGRYPAVGWRAQTRERPERHKCEAGIWSCLGLKRRRKAPECRCMTQTAYLPPARNGRTASRGPAPRGLVICLYKGIVFFPADNHHHRPTNRCDHPTVTPQPRATLKRALKTSSIRLGVVSDCWKGLRPTTVPFFFVVSAIAPSLTSTLNFYIHYRIPTSL